MMLHTLRPSLLKRHTAARHTQQQDGTQQQEAFEAGRTRQDGAVDVHAHKEAADGLPHDASYQAHKAPNTRHKTHKT